MSYYGIRAAEDIYIKGYQKIGKSLNERAGISEKNKKRNRYYETYDTYLGNDNLIRDKDNCVNCGTDPTTPLFKN